MWRAPRFHDRLPSSRPGSRRRRRAQGTWQSLDGQTGSGRARLAVIPSASQSALEGFVQGHVVEGSTVFTDGWAGYDRLQTLGYHHQPENLGRQAKPSPDPASHPPSLLEPQDVARRDSPRRQLQECPGIPPRVRVPVQPTTDTDGCLSEPAWAHQPPPP